MPGLFLVLAAVLAFAVALALLWSWLVIRHHMTH
jgi:hypothetical protein